MTFPVYRKYSNNKSYFKVLSEKEFEEIVLLGNNYWVYTFEAKILPDFQLIRDMLELQDGRWQEISETEYRIFLETCRQEYKKRHV